MKKILIISFIFLISGKLLSQESKTNNIENFKIILEEILELEEVKKAFRSYNEKKSKEKYTVVKIPELSESSFSPETIEIGKKKVNYWPIDYIFVEDLYCLQIINLECSESSFMLEFRTYSTGNMENSGVKYILGYIHFLKKGDNEDWQVSQKKIRFVDYNDLYPNWHIGFYIK